MIKELEALECFKDIEKRCKNDYEECIVGYDYEKELSTIKQALQRLEAIDNAKPNEALIYTNALIEENDADIKNQNITGFDVDTQAKWVKYLNDKSSLLNTIEQALLKSQEQEKVLEIIKEKGVDVGYLKTCKTLKEYNSTCCWEDEKDFNKRLTQEEFDLLKRWIENGN